MNDVPTTPQPIAEAEADTDAKAASDAATTVAEPTSRGKQPVTRNQAAVGLAIVVAALGGFFVGQSSNDAEPIGMRGMQAMRSMQSMQDMQDRGGWQMQPDGGPGGHFGGGQQGPHSGGPFGNGSDEPQSEDDGADDK